MLLTTSIQYAATAYSPDHIPPQPALSGKLEDTSTLDRHLIVRSTSDYTE